MAKGIEAELEPLPINGTEELTPLPVGVGMTVTVGLASMHEQIVLIKCGSRARQIAPIDELAALLVAEVAVIIGPWRFSPRLLIWWP